MARRIFALRALAVLALLGGMLLLASCGYRHGANGAPCPPEGVSTLAIAKVENNTLDPGLAQSFRSLFRDEMVRHSCGRFVDRSVAEGLVDLYIVSVTEGTRVEDPNGNTVKLEVVVTLRAVIRRRLDNTNVWDSGQVSDYETFFGVDAQSARTRAIELGTRKLVDQISVGF